MAPVTFFTSCPHCGASLEAPSQDQLACRCGWFYKPVDDLAQHLHVGDVIRDDFCNGYFGRDWHHRPRVVVGVGRKWCVIQDSETEETWFLGCPGRIGCNPSVEEIQAWFRGSPAN
jgi:hypothetical protein